MNFLQELFNRFKLKSPQFFVVIQNIALVATVITGLPMLLSEYEATMHVQLPAVIHVLSSKAVFVASSVLFITAKLPVDNSTGIARSTNKLPYTRKKD